MTPIIRALALGYAAPEVLEFVGRAFPSLASKIKRAKSGGYPVEQILNIINQGMGGKSDDNLTEAQIHHRRDENQGQVSKDLLKLGGGALGGLVASQALPAFANSLKGSLGPSSSIGSGAVADALQSGNQESLTKGSQLSQNPSIPNTEQQTITPQSLNGQNTVPTIPQQPPVDSRSILRQMELEPKINNLLKAGNTPDVIGGALDKMLTPVQKKWLDRQIKEGKAKSLPKMVADYAQSESTTEKKAEPEEKAKPLDFSKGSIVATPHGNVGELETSRNGQALVKDESGKLHNFKQEDLIPSPLPKKELADLHNELISGIEEETGEDVSRMVNWCGYNPETNTLAFLPHIGALYTYSNIDPEDVALLTSVLSTRKTSGGNFIGAWKQGSKSPIGAAMSALIKKLQAERGGKGNEYEEKFETIYDATEPAKLAAKKKKAEEDKRKRKEKR